MHVELEESVSEVQLVMSESKSRIHGIPRILFVVHCRGALSGISDIDFATGI